VLALSAEHAGKSIAQRWRWNSSLLEYLTLQYLAEHAGEFDRRFREVRAVHPPTWSCRGHLTAAVSRA
jgi:hypothetical protein